MAEQRGCPTCKHQFLDGDEEPCLKCFRAYGVKDETLEDCYEPMPKPTNADHIRSMSDDELAKMITSGEMCAICPFCLYYDTDNCYMNNEGMHKNCDEGILDWLKSERKAD